MRESSWLGRALATLEVRETHAYAEKLHRDYGYDQLEPLDRDGIRRLIGSKVYKGGEMDRGAGHLHPLLQQCQNLRPSRWI